MLKGIVIVNLKWHSIQRLQWSDSQR